MQRRFFLKMMTALPLGPVAAAALTQPAAAADVAPMVIAVALGSQTMAVYRHGQIVHQSPISSGKRGHATPTGIFSILDKRRHHRSNIYSNAPMPFMQRLTWSGIALHEGHLPGYPASHGCVRIPDRFARDLFSITDIGAHVIIADGLVGPTLIDHPMLFQPRRPDADLIADGMELRLETMALDAGPLEVASLDMAHPVQSQRQVETDGPPVRIMITRRTQRETVRHAQQLLNRLGLEAGPDDGALGPLTIAALKAFQRESGYRESGTPDTQTLKHLHAMAGTSQADSEPASGHLYVRKGFVPLFDSPVSIDQPEEELGAHLLHIETVAGARATWQGFTVKPAQRSLRETLSRIRVPADAAERLGTLITAGASLVITDNGFGRETGKGTDFIVLT
jgi:peptidoglycan hydrolase-like protein with peptidoglycan-binding domain